MYKNKDPSGEFLFRSVPRLFGNSEPYEEMLLLERELRKRNLIYNPQVQRFIKAAAIGTAHTKAWARNWLKRTIESDRIMDMRTGDVFRPLAPPHLLAAGNLHICNQVDGNPWFIPANALTRGAFLAGPQGGGKSRLLLHIARQLNGLDPPVPFMILDPKNDLRNWTEYLNACYIDISDISIDLSPPPGLTYEQWLVSLVPQIGDVIGAIYGIEILQDAGAICIEKRKKHIASTGSDTAICLNDIYLAISQVDNTHSGRRQGYKDALSTGISRILSGSGDLFKCRKGIDMAEAFKNNVIIGCRSLTDEFATKYLAMHLLYWLYENSRHSPATDELLSVLILDDATRFIAARGGFDAATKTSNFTNIYAVLRSSGRGVIVTSQIPHLADPGILALSHNVWCSGALHHSSDTKVLADIMGLSDSQRIGLTRLKNREVIGISAGSAWVHPVHGFTVDVVKDGKGG